MTMKFASVERSSSSDFVKMPPSLRLLTFRTPMTRFWWISGTESRDLVLYRCRLLRWKSGCVSTFSISSGLPVRATQPVMPSPTRGRQFRTISGFSPYEA